MRFCLTCLALLAFHWAAHAQLAQTPPLLDAAKAGEPPKTIALVSAVGGQFQLVQAQLGTSSRIDPFVRRQYNLSSQVLNHAVLRGLDTAVAQLHPESKRVLLTVPAANVEQAGQNQRAQAVADDLLKRITALDSRQAWDWIIAVTPRYSIVGGKGMGERLWGLGAYVYSLESAQVELETDDGNKSSVDFESTEDVRTIDGKPAPPSGQYVAPYAYLRFTVYNAKTMQVLRTVDRFDAKKIVDPNCTSVNVGNCFDIKQYANQLLESAERTASAGVIGKTQGRVEMGDVKRVEPSSAPIPPK